MLNSVCVVGTGVSGVRAAEELRLLGYEGQLTMVGSESHLPYERPTLSKDVLLTDGKPTPVLLHDEPWYAQQQIELQLETRVVRLYPGNRPSVMLDRGGVLRTDAVIVATGGRPRRLQVPGAHLAGVQYLRDLDDALALRDRLVAGARLLVVGGGVIGTEVAAAAVQRGLEVTVIEATPHLLGRIGSPLVVDAIIRAHRERRVDFRVDTHVTRFIGDRQLRAVELHDGSVLRADVAVVGIGIDAEHHVLGAMHQDGLAVDEQFRTALPNVYAAGDVASVRYPGSASHVRLEQFRAAQEQGAAAARAVLGLPAEFDPLPWFWSDQYDSRFQLGGMPNPHDEVIVRGNPQSANFAVFHMRCGKVAAVAGVNRPKDVRAGIDFMRSGAEVAQDALADPTTNLRALARSVAT